MEDGELRGFCGRQEADYDLLDIIVMPQVQVEIVQAGDEK